METPNTRSRTKRDLESSTSSSQDEPRVRWECDKRLYRAMMSNVDNDAPIPLPAPTQKPILPLISRNSPRDPTNSISNSTATNSNSLSSSSITSSNRPRKRPCRNRSLPNNSNNSNSTPQNSTTSMLSGASSAPSAMSFGGGGGSSSSGGSGLDSLLQEAMVTFHLRSPKTPTVSKSVAAGSSKTATATARVIPQKQGSMAGRSVIPLHSTSSTNRTNVPPRSHATPTTATKPHMEKPSTGNTSKIPTPTVKAGVLEKSTPLKREFSRTASSESRQSTGNTGITKTPSYGNNIGQTSGPPRIGLRSTQQQSTITNRNIQSQYNRHGPAAAAAPFKSPLLAAQNVNVQAVRSSPRRTPAGSKATTSAKPAATVNQTPVRASMPAKVLPQGPIAKPSPLNNQQSRGNTAAVTTENGQGRGQIGNQSTLKPLPRLEDKMPSSDGGGTGDESFDSFDGIFAEGGEDVEQLLRAIDG